MPPAPDPALPHVPSRPRSGAHHRTAPGVLLAVGLLLGSGCTTTDLTLGSAAPTTVAASPAPAVDRAKALAALDALPVRGRAPRTGYSREAFGPSWSDVDRNGCDTRNDVLRRDLTAVVAKPGTQGCVIVRGVLADPYTGRRITFTRGQDTSAAVQIDHVVALSDAWQKGAQRLSADRRRQLANDPLNLLAVDGPTNAAKSDGDAATWLPPNRGYRCAYVARQVAVKAAYQLWMTSGEKSAARRMLELCPVSKPKP